MSETYANGSLYISAYLAVSCNYTCACRLVHPTPLLTMAWGGGGRVVQCVSCSGVLQAFDVRECAHVYGANVLSLVQSSRPLRDRVAAVAGGSSRGSGVGVGGGGGVGGGVVGAGAVQAGGSAKELLMTLPCPSAQTVSKYNSQYHKLFQCVPKDEILMKGTGSLLMLSVSSFSLSVFFSLWFSLCCSLSLSLNSPLSPHIRSVCILTNSNEQTV